MRLRVMQEQEIRELYREWGWPYQTPEVRHQNFERIASARVSPPESLYQRRLSPTLTVQADNS